MTLVTYINTVQIVNDATTQRTPLRLLFHLGHGIVQCVPTVITIQDYSIPTHEKHQWLLLQCYSAPDDGRKVRP